MSKNPFSNSTYASNLTYDQLGAEGLAGITSMPRTLRTVDYLLKYIRGTDKILDLGCGYGRVSLPLASRGLNVTGLDLNPTLLTEAQKKASQLKDIELSFVQGSMLALPFRKQSFDLIVCLWLTFNHLLTKEDQLQALNEIYRTLSPGGMAIVEMTNGEHPSTQHQLRSEGEGEDSKVLPILIHDFIFYYYIHTTTSFQELCHQSDFTDYNVQVTDFAYEPRLVAILARPT